MKDFAALLGRASPPERAGLLADLAFAEAREALLLGDVAGAKAAMITYSKHVAMEQRLLREKSQGPSA